MITAHVVSVDLQLRSHVDLRIRPGKQPAQRLTRIRAVRVLVHDHLSVEANPSASRGNSAEALLRVGVGSNVLNHRISVLNLVLAAHRYIENTYVGMLSGQFHAYGGARRKGTEIDGVQLIPGIFGERCVQRVKPDRLRAGLLNTVMLHRGIPGDLHDDRAIDEVRIAADAEVSLNQADVRAFLDLKVHTRI